MYEITAIPTIYAEVLFRSRLEARYAAFFDFAEWEWEYEPLDLKGWIPDFLVTIPCDCDECGARRGHRLLAEVKPYYTIGEFYETAAWKMRYGPMSEDQALDRLEFLYPYGNVAVFGNNPSVSYWEMSHASGGGDWSIPEWIADWQIAWEESWKFCSVA